MTANYVHNLLLHTVSLFVAHNQKLWTQLTPSCADPNHTSLCHVCSVCITDSISRYYLIQLKDLSVYHINVLSICNNFTILIGYMFRLL